MLTKKLIEAVIVSEEYIKVGMKTTICLLTLQNGFEVIGTSACVNPAEYDIEIGKKFARERAVEKVWELQGYLSQYLRHEIQGGARVVFDWYTTEELQAKYGDGKVKKEISE